MFTNIVLVTQTAEQTVPMFKKKKKNEIEFPYGVFLYMCGYYVMWGTVCECVCLCACERVRVRAHVCVCVRACVYVCMQARVRACFLALDNRFVCSRRDVNT